MAATRYLRLEPRGFTYGECWRVANDLPALWLVLLAKWGLKPFTFPLTVTAGSEFPEVDPADVLPSAAARLDEPVAVLESLGFVVTNHGSQPQVGKLRFHHVVLLLSTDRTVGAAVTDFQNGFQIVTVTGLTTRFDDGTFAVSSSDRYVLQQPPEFHWESHPGVSPDRLYELHLARVERLRDEGRTVRKFDLREPALVAAHLTRRQFDYYLDRGAMVELTAAELDDRLAQAEAN